MRPGEPKRGVSLYSYQQEYYLRQMSLEDCIRVSAEFGAYGIESIGEQMMPGFPDLSDAFYEQWHGFMEQYGTTPTAHDQFLDLMLYKDRQMTEEEALASMRSHIDHAARLGCTVIRVIAMTPVEIVEKSIPHAAERGIKLALEIHAPRHFETEWFQGHWEVYQRYGPENVGFTPDMGIFVRRFPRVISERAVRDGAQADVVRRIVAAYDEAAASADGTAMLAALAGLPAEIEEHGGNEPDIALARMVSHFVNLDPAALQEYMPYVHHIHAKFYEMTDEGSEYSIPYEEILPILAEGGFSGYLSSEYEGQRHTQDAFDVDSVEQVRRQQDLFARVLEATN
jgi:sugar phosphate isomerase/epimerase